MVEPNNDDRIMVKFKFNYDEKFCVKMLTKDVFEEMKKASTIEYCEIVNWHD